MEKLSQESSNNWLERLKDESWEAELLISAIAIFGTLQLFKVIDWATNIFIDMLLPKQYLIGYGIVFGGLLAVSILVSMFIIHFSLRAYWVGLVGLNSVFPEYGLEDSAYSEIFTKKILAILPKLKKTIHEVDELCSVIFSAAFFMLLMYLYLSLTASILLFLFNFLSEYIKESILLIPIYILGGLFIILSASGIIANLKFFKQNKRIQVWYFNVTKWGSIIMLGPLYKYLLQISMTFSTNFKKKKSIIGLVVIFIVVGFVIATGQFSNSKIPYLVNQKFYFDKTKAYSGYYNSRLNVHEFLIAPQIESDIIDSKITQLFIPIYRYEKNLIKNICTDFEENEKWTNEERRMKKKEWYLTCYDEYHQVFLNGERISTDFIKYSLPETDQYGIIDYINLKEATEGKNTIKVIKKLGDDPIEWNIPFQYIPSN